MNFQSDTTFMRKITLKLQSVFRQFTTQSMTIQTKLVSALTKCIMHLKILSLS